MRDVLAIRTPENVRFEFELPGIATRAVAWVIDVLAMGLMLLLASIVAMSLTAFVGEIGGALYVVLAFVIQWGYGTLCEWRFSGQTLGKRINSVRVLQGNGIPITFAQSAIRNLLRIVDLMPALYLFGGASALLDDRGRRLGDLAAGTVVVRVRKSPRPSAIVAPLERFNSLLDDARVAHASQRVTARERDVMVAVALRREQLPLPVRYALFTTLAAHLERRLGVPRPTHLSEERYVLNLTAVVLGLAHDPTAPSAPRASS